MRLSDLIAKAEAHVLAWATSLAASLVVLRAFTPNFIDFVFDMLSAALVYVAAKLAQRAAERKAGK